MPGQRAQRLPCKEDSSPSPLLSCVALGQFPNLSEPQHHVQDAGRTTGQWARPTARPRGGYCGWQYNFSPRGVSR